MLLQNLGLTWTDQPACDGHVIRAAALTYPELLKRVSEDTLVVHRFRLFDPQHYLVRGLRGNDNRRTVERLASYPYFKSNAPSYENKEGVRNYRRKLSALPKINVDLGSIPTNLAACLELQKQLGVSLNIIPTPALDNIDGIVDVMQWVDSARSIFPDDSLVTLALTESALRHDDIVSVLLDNIMARPFRGVYFVLVSESDSLRITDKTVVTAIFELCHHLSRREQEIFLNFVDDLGALCCGVGATGYATGSNRKDRRLCWSDYSEGGFGQRLPYFYSFNLFADLRPELDVKEKISDNGFLYLLDGDWTVHSEPLRSAIVEGRSADTVPQWSNRHMNIKTANNHRFARLSSVRDALRDQTRTESLEWVSRQIGGAAMRAKYLEARFMSEPVSADLRHCMIWDLAYGAFRKKIREK